MEFARDVEPILRSSCVPCHGPQKQKGQLRLDSRAGALKGGLGGPALVPGAAARSRFITLLLEPEAEDRMPQKAPPLSPLQVELLRTWIDQGAAWPDPPTAPSEAPVHWAYVKPPRPPPPSVRNAAGIRNPIDAFVRSTLERESLDPSPEAPRETLFRRLCLDLVGLPPTPEELAEFLSDASPGSYERAVDRLLASPHFGERWARPWLDAARYADTNGYEVDQPRTMWKYRDWVIQAFNDDLPFDRFTIEQLAGDLLPGATLDQRVASGFHRNTLKNEEAGIDAEEARWERLVDRVNTTGAVWMGTTLGCAQCHNHKYDPFSQKDYYGLLAFFETSEEVEIELPSASQEVRWKELRDEIHALEERVLRQTTPELDAARERWETEVLEAEPAWARLHPDLVRSSNGSTLLRQEDGSVLAQGLLPDQDVYTVTVRVPPEFGAMTAFRLEALVDASLPGSGPGRGTDGNFVLTEVRVLADGKPVALGRPVSDFSQDGHPVTQALDGDARSGWAILPEYSRSHAALFETAAPVKAEILTVVLEQTGAQPGRLIGRFRLSATTSEHPATSLVMPSRIRDLLVSPPGGRGASDREELSAYFRSVTPLLARERALLAGLKRELRELGVPTALALRERPSQESPSTLLRLRGSFTAKGAKVEAGVPAPLHPLSKGPRPDRLALARWLVDAENPLTARVTVNRFWAEIFGRGIVETCEDFGTQGSPPSHPELLDWLAAEFMTKGWRVKDLLRTILTSATYRQSSRMDRAALERDPHNRLLARGPRFRMEAEMVRDSILAAGGILSRKIGGPSVFPPQPEGVWLIPGNQPHDRWVESRGPDRFRRGIYTFWRRTAPYPSLASMDAPSREICSVRRVRTNTPLQSLILLNDPSFVEAARGLARAVAGDGDGGIEEAFRRVTGRSPDGPERATLRSAFEREVERFTRDRESARKLVGPGPATPPSSLPRLAAATAIANVLLNLDEAVTKE